MSNQLLADGLVVFVKRACPTCAMMEPLLCEAAAARADFQVVTQDTADFPAGVRNRVHDRELDHSWLNNIEATPTLIRFSGGEEAERVMGWDRAAWQRLTGMSSIGKGLPASQPG
jgi:hypothetical protein